MSRVSLLSVLAQLVVVVMVGVDVEHTVVEALLELALLSARHEEEPCGSHHKDDPEGDGNRIVGVTKPCTLRTALKADPASLLAQEHRLT